jgi:hypothetical protein
VPFKMVYMSAQARSTCIVRLMYWLGSVRTNQYEAMGSDD